MLIGNDQELLPQEKPQQAELLCTTSEDAVLQSSAGRALAMTAARAARQATGFRRWHSCSADLCLSHLA
jgi:hypothetical protein